MRKYIYILLMSALCVAPATLSMANKPKQQKTRNPKRFTQPKKHTTFIVFISADNDLHYFAWHNIEQMKRVGSNEHINVIVQINSPGISTPTRRFYIEKNNLKLVSPILGEVPQKLNSGSPQTLIDCVQWASEDFPAEHYVLVLWDHATGALEPGPYRTVNTNELFFVNPESNKLELDRGGEGFFTVLNQELTHKNKKAICFDDSYQSYISNRELEFALEEIHRNVLKKPLDGVGFDACLMSMIEIATLAKDHARFMVGSQEIEYGNGWNYEKILQAFVDGPVRPREFFKHMVRAYDEEYRPIANDFTQSAFDLTLAQDLEENVHHLAQLLVKLFSEQKSKNIKSLIKLCKSPQYCTCFDEPSYIDLGHFYKNLIKYLPHTQYSDQEQGAILLKHISSVLYQGLEIIDSIVIQNSAGNGLRNAHGISIYFPEYRIATSYLYSSFGQNNDWRIFLEYYLST